MPVISEAGIGTMPFGRLKLQDESFANPRTSSGLDTTSIRELAVHIGRYGLMVPLIVRSDGLILAGQRRYRAIEWLIRNFTASADSPTAEDRSVLAQYVSDMTHAELSEIEKRAARFLDAVPIRQVAGSGLDGIALADNIMRSDLSAYEITVYIARLSDEGATGRDLAKLIGKSPSYVSKKLSAWRGSGPELRTAWERGLDEPTVFELAALPHEKQAKALLGPTGRRGAANRPGIEAIKDALMVLERVPGTLDDYTEAIRETLRWVTGRKVSETFARIVSGDEAP